MRAAAENPGEVTLVCLAPLTNVAAAYLKDGETFSKLKKIVMMGGQVNGDYAEWNFRCDAKAAKIVFESGMPIKMIGINVTKYCKLTEREISFVNASESVNGKLLSQMLKNGSRTTTTKKARSCTTDWPSRNSPKISAFTKREARPYAKRAKTRERSRRENIPQRWRRK